MLNPNQYKIYSTNHNRTGKLSNLNFEDGEITIKDGEETFNEDMQRAIALPFIVNFNGYDLFHLDVIVNSDGVCMEIEKLADDNAQLHQVDPNDDYKRVSSGSPFNPDELNNVLTKDWNFHENLMVLLGAKVDGNSVNDEPEHNLSKDFNIKVGVIADKYYYICNYKEYKKIDLILAVFAGSTFVEDDYMRITLDYDEYDKAIKEGTIKVASMTDFNSNFADKYYEVHSKKKNTYTDTEVYGDMNGQQSEDIQEQPKENVKNDINLEDIIKKIEDNDKGEWK